MINLGYTDHLNSETVCQSCTNSGTLTPDSGSFNGLIGGAREASHVHIED